LTARWRDQATRPRHKRTDMARKPRMAPTTMKTVPSGREEVRMNGASAVGGTDGATIENAPERVGRPEGSAPPDVADDPPVMTGMEPLIVAP